ncbi:hypothetical protein [Frondihabitans sp. VKM Ac-2883]|jgi:hypothetical protein|uniref:hypothetical protein n=1 Tax=Frondihabitans sp. VKM Ac-2883 TaxID=2783823 RepID=UPI00188A307A|nr:hypothetical protein [Frondihabitans sp. VKM Ac-2883]MBF4577761.1 hypothetical protein [Frondihabitans sp. VKM Ac-2883]
MSLPQSDVLRSSGGYALVDGVWWSSSRPIDGEDAVLLQETDGPPAKGFSAGSRPGVYLRKVAPDEITQFAKIVVTASIDGLGPFAITAVSLPQVHVVYRGTDRDAAALLPGLSTGDAYQEGGDVLGTVDLSRVTNVREKISPISITP